VFVCVCVCACVHNCVSMHDWVWATQQLCVGVLDACACVCVYLCECECVCIYVCLFVCVRGVLHCLCVQGGVVGGNLARGVIKIGDEVEIRPGLVQRDGTIQPIRTRITSIRTDENELKQAIPGGLIALGLNVDPTCTRSNRMVLYLTLCICAR